MKIAILGGSFNPIHFGHLALAKKVYTELDYDKIAIVPTFISPFKQNIYNSNIKQASTNNRLKMIKLAITDIPYLYCEKYELEKKGVSYTIDTVNYFYQVYPEIKKPIGLIIGDDLANSFFKWKSASELLEKTNLIIAHREIKNLKKLNLQENNLIQNVFTELHNSILPISSSQIRSAILGKKDFTNLVPKKVYDYIIKNKLYQEL